VDDQVLERVERHLFPAAADHLTRNRGLSWPVAVFVQPLDQVDLHRRIAGIEADPLGGIAEDPGEDGRPARERERRRGRRRARDSDEILRAERLLHELLQRRADLIHHLRIQVMQVDEDHEDTRPWIGRHLLAGANAVRLHAQRLRAARRDAHVLEGFDRLRNVVLEQLELVPPEIDHGPSVHGGVQVYADVIGAATERRLLGRARVGRLGGKGGHGQRRQCKTEPGGGAGPADRWVPPSGDCGAARSHAHGPIFGEVRRCVVYPAKMAADQSVPTAPVGFDNRVNASDSRTPAPCRALMRVKVTRR
jgi:hypothetical protein